MNRKQIYVTAYDAGQNAFCLDAMNPASHTNQGESNRWTDYRDDYLLPQACSAEDQRRHYDAFCDGYRDASDEEPS